MNIKAYRLNSEGLVHDLIEDEVIVLSVKSGTYHNVTGSGVDIWQWLAEPRSLADLTAGLAARYGAIDGLEADSAVFIEALEREGLVVADFAASIPVAPSGPAAAGYRSPQIATFEDLQDLLTIDPIHDVDDSGWPNARRP